MVKIRVGDKGMICRGLRDLDRTIGQSILFLHSPFTEKGKVGALKRSAEKCPADQSQVTVNSFN